MRPYSFLMIVLVIVVVACLGITYWPSQHSAPINLPPILTLSEEPQDLQAAKDLIQSNDIDDALRIIAKYKNEIEAKSSSGKKWAELFIVANEKNHDLNELKGLFEFWPETFRTHEKAVLLVAEKDLLLGQTEKYEALRALWKGKETMPNAWFILDADLLFLEGKREKALAFLKSLNFEGAKDTPRLLRLALAYANENPKLAWEYLNEAHAKDPLNSSIRSYRAKLLEAVGKNASSFNEYVAAIKADPKDLYLKDQFAEFLIRNKRIPQALEVWQDSLKTSSLDLIWVKALFWSRVANPISYDWSKAQIPNGTLAPYAGYLASLKPGKFWDDSTFATIPDCDRLLQTEQSTFWLRLAEALKNDDEDKAVVLLQNNPFNPVSFNPHLELALKRILNYRRSGTLALPEDKLANHQDTASERPTSKDLLFGQLEALAQDPSQALPFDLKSLLHSDAAFSAAFLAADWYEAAIQTNPLKIIPQDFPEWFAYGMTHALKTNRGIVDALEYASLQKATPRLSLQIAELMIAAKDINSAIDQLTKLVQYPNQTGYQAASLLSRLYIERGQLHEAKAIIKEQPAFLNDISGQEALARIALLENNGALAEKIYLGIEAKSSEAKSFLARKAFAEKNWPRARQLTEQLIQQYPNNSLLQDNMKKIAEEEQKPKKNLNS